MIVRKKFRCDCCGLCCKYYTPQILPPEYIDPETGWCKYLDPETNLCQIYESRPAVCRMDCLYPLYKDELGINSISEWYKKNEEICKKLKETYKDE